MVSKVVVGINPPDGKWLQQCQKVIQIFMLPCSKCKRKRGIGCMIYRPPLFSLFYHLLFPFSTAL